MAVTAHSFYRTFARSVRAAATAAVMGAAAVLATSNAVQAGAAGTAPWCAFLGGQSGYDCSYFTFDRCMETARGLGNFCVPNPQAAPTGGRERRPRR